MWRIVYVDTVNPRSHMPTMKRRQPTSGLRGPPSLMVFIIIDVREYTERSQGERVPYEERPFLSLICKISPCETRGRFCGGTSLPHIRKKTARQGLGQTGPRPRQRGHHRRRRPLYKLKKYKWWVQQHNHEHQTAGLRRPSDTQDTRYTTHKTSQVSPRIITKKYCQVDETP